jgi:tetratricopeptide (TPR) repeat protein
VAKRVPAPVAASPTPRATGAESANQLERLGRTRNSEESFRDAVELLSRAIQLDPQLASAYNARGFARLKLTQLEPAIADFSDAIRLRATYANAYHNRSVARRKMGDKTGAEEDARKAAELLSGVVAHRAETTTAQR